MHDYLNRVAKKKKIRIIRTNNREILRNENPKKNVKKLRTRLEFQPARIYKPRQNMIITHAEGRNKNITLKNKKEKTLRNKNHLMVMEHDNDTAKNDTTYLLICLLHTQISFNPFRLIIFFFFSIFGSAMLYHFSQVSIRMLYFFVFRFDCRP